MMFVMVADDFSLEGGRLGHYWYNLFIRKVKIACNVIKTPIFNLLKLSL